ncbi:MAG: CAP domain-containing protein [Gaiellaceae bacterium]
MRTVVLALAAALVLCAPAAAHRATARSEASLLSQMNDVRAQYGLAPLALDPRLGRAARTHSRDMLDANVFDHGDFADRMSQFDVTGGVAGENLAWGTGPRGSAQGIVVAWLASPEHRANLLRASFTLVGIGDLVGPFQGHARAHVVTADFAE